MCCTGWAPEDIGNMESIHNDQELRKALHSIYAAQFDTLKKFPKAFTKADATRMLTGLMGSQSWSWRVIGITSDALDVFSKNEFKRPTGQIQRGRRDNRASTVRALFFERAEPMPLDEFFEFFLKREETVLMTKRENQHRQGKEFPDFIPIDAHHALFPCGTLVGWKHRKAEVDFLRELHAKQLEAR